MPRIPIAIAVLMSALAGCSRPPAPPNAASRPAPRPAAAGPHAAIARIIELHRTRKYTELRAAIVPGHSAEVVNTLMAVDEFMDTNQRLCNWIRDHVGMGLARTIDQSYINNLLGLFSGAAELLDESVIGNTATVSFTVADRLPAERALLRWVDNQWRYDPESGYTSDLPAAFREMARGLEQVRLDLERGQITAADLRNNPDRLIDKVQASMRRGVDRLSKARTAAEATSQP